MIRVYLAKWGNRTYVRCLFYKRTKLLTMLLAVLLQNIKLVLEFILSWTRVGLSLLRDHHVICKSGSSAHHNFTTTPECILPVISSVVPCSIRNSLLSLSILV
jgi:hypothetical protein